MSTPPPVGKTGSFKIDQQAYDDLTTMLATGMTVSDAIRSALHIVAGTYRKAWEGGAVQQDVRPTIERFWITRYEAGQEPARGSVQAVVPTAYRACPTPHPTITPPGATGRPTRPTPVRRSV